MAAAKAFFRSAKATTRITAASRGGPDVCGASNPIRQPRAFAESTANSAIYFVTAAVTTSQFPPPPVVPASPKPLALRSTSCRPLKHPRSPQSRWAREARRLTEPPTEVHPLRIRARRPCYTPGGHTSVHRLKPFTVDGDQPSLLIELVTWAESRMVPETLATRLAMMASRLLFNSAARRACSRISAPSSVSQKFGSIARAAGRSGRARVRRSGG